MSNGCDIAWQKPSGAALQGAGYKVASLYVGQDNTGKNMTAAVVADYRAHGLGIIVNFEYGAQQMLGGAAQGHVDALLGRSQAIAAGVAFRMAYYSADWAASAAQMPVIIAYLVAARSATGPGTVGVYGSYYTVKAVSEYWQAHYPGEKVWLWQTVAWSNGNVFPNLDMYQDGNQFMVGSVAVDYDLVISADAGQWPAPAETLPPEGESMQIAEYADGRQIVAYVNPVDNNVYVSEQTSPGSIWTPPVQPGGPVPFGGTTEVVLNIAKNGPTAGTPSVVAESLQSGAVYTSWKNPDGSWAKWAKIA